VKHDFAYGARQEFLRPTVGWQREFAIWCLVFAIIVALSTDSYGSEKGGSIDPAYRDTDVTGDAHPQLSHPICPSGWSIAQRYDVRDRNGQIIVSKDHWIRVNERVVRTGWHRTCVTPIVWVYR
jgi:hypothetical protein